MSRTTSDEWILETILVHIYIVRLDIYTYRETHFTKYTLHEFSWIFFNHENHVGESRVHWPIFLFWACKFETASPIGSNKCALCRPFIGLLNRLQWIDSWNFFFVQLNKEKNDSNRPMKPTGRLHWPGGRDHWPGVGFIGRLDWCLPTGYRFFVWS